jgi:hypothetical protein
LNFGCCLTGANAFKACAVVLVEPVERRARFRIQSELGTILNEVGALFWVIHHAFSLNSVRPGLDLSRRPLCAVGLQPIPDLFISFRSSNDCFELLAIDSLEAEEHVVQRTIVMIFTERPGQAGAAFVNGPTRDGEPADAFTRAVRSLFA